MNNENEYRGGFLNCSLGMALALIIGGFFLCFSTIYFVNVIRNEGRLKYKKNKWYRDYISIFFYLYNL